MKESKGPKKTDSSIFFLRKDLGHLNDENLNLVYPAGSHLSKILDKVSGVSIFFFEFKPKPNYCIGSRFLS